MEDRNTGSILFNKTYVNGKVSVGDKINRDVKNAILKLGEKEKKVCIKFFPYKEDERLKVLVATVMDFLQSQFHHRNVMKYIGYFVGDDQSLGLIMDKYDRTLADLIESQLTTPQKNQIILDVALGLQFLNRDSKFHMDLKQSNVFVELESETQLYRAVLYDFDSGINGSLRSFRPLWSTSYNFPNFEQYEKDYRRKELIAFGGFMLHILTNTSDNEEPDEFIRNKGTDSKEIDWEEIDALYRSLVKRCYLLQKDDELTLDEVVNEIILIQNKSHVSMNEQL